jgi:hypothetical protein
MALFHYQLIILIVFIILLINFYRFRNKNYTIEYKIETPNTLSGFSINDVNMMKDETNLKEISNIKKENNKLININNNNNNKQNQQEEVNKLKVIDNSHHLYNDHVETKKDLIKVEWEKKDLLLQIDSHIDFNKYYPSYYSWYLCIHIYI